MAAERERLLQALGEPVQKRDTTMHQLIKRFSTAYCELIDGLAVEAISKASLQNENSLTGGSLINRDIFYGSFKTELDEIVALDGVTMPQTLRILRCTTASRHPSNHFIVRLLNSLKSAILTIFSKGLQPHVVVSDKAFLHLVKEQVESLKGPSERCVERVHDELKRIVRLCGEDVEVQYLTFFHEFTEHFRKLLSN